MSEPIVSDGTEINYWLPIQSLVSFVENQLEETKDQVLEITSSFPKKIFRHSTKILNWILAEEDLQRKFSELYPHTDFVFLRHSLEKMDNPRGVLKLLKAISKRGYISPPACA